MTQYPLVLMPDAVLVATTLLTAGLDDLGSTTVAYDAVPSPRPDEFVTVRRTGGPRYGKVHDRAQLTVESWASTDEAAMDLAQKCRAIFNAATGTVVASVPVGRVDEASGPADLPDISDQPRVSQTFIVTLRGAPPA